jgi:Zn-dependent protease
VIFDILGWGFSGPEITIVLVAFALAIVIAITCHEYAHGFAALRNGDPTAKMAGRLTFNPAKHFEPLGLLCFLFAGIGWAKPVPVNPYNYRNFKKANFWVSISGVLVNIVLGFIFSFGYFMADKYGWADSGNLALFGLYYAFMFCMLINLSLAVFNLLPIPPLDGYNLLVSFTKPDNKFMQFMRQNAMIVLIVFVLFGGFIIFTVRGYLESAFLAFWGLFI